MLCLKLETVVKPLPADTRVKIRPRSALGLKYVQLTRGTSTQDLAANSTIPLRQALPQPVELDEFFDMFPDAHAARDPGQPHELRRAASPRAGRTSTSRSATSTRCWTTSTPVMRNLGEREDRPPGLLGRPGAERRRRRAGRRGAGRRCAANLDTTFSALADVADPYIKETIAEGPPTLRTAIRTLPIIQPFLANTAELFTAFQPGFENFAAAAPDSPRPSASARPRSRTRPAFNARLATTFKALETFSTDPLVKLGFQDLTSTVSIAGPLVSYITPSQTSCNYMGMFFKNLSSALSEGGTNGQTLRVAIIAAPGGQPVPNQTNIDNTLLAPNNEGSPSSAPANGPSGPGYDASNYLHSNPFPFTAAPSQPKMCEAGNEKFLPGKLVIGNVPGQTPTTLHYDTKLTPAEQQARTKGGSLP